MGNVCCSSANEDRMNKGKTNQTNQENNFNANYVPNSSGGKPSFNKEKCKSIAYSLPTRTQTSFQNLKDTLKSKTSNLSPIEKSYVIFRWICDNIAYDADSFFAGRDVDCTPEGVYNSGISVCSGYSRLYKDFATYLGLEVECVSCYAKGVGYEPGQRLTKTDHEYNVIKLDNKWYPIDSTWGAGHIKDRRFVKEYNEFYFLADPELLIKTHFPEDEKWQLTKRRYSFEEFLKWPLVKEEFYKCGFENYYPEEGLIELRSENSKKFIVYANNMSSKTAMADIYLLQGNVYQQLLNSTSINFYDDRFEVDCIFNKKGKYKVTIFGNNDRSANKSNDILEYIVNVQNNAKKQLSFPRTFKGSEEINIIEPLYNNLKTGQRVKFKIKSNLDEIIIIDEEWHHLHKNPNGYFELETTIQTQRGNNVIVGKSNPPNSCGYLVSYDVV